MTPSLTLTTISLSYLLLYSLLLPPRLRGKLNKRKLIYGIPFLPCAELDGIPFF